MQPTLLVSSLKTLVLATIFTSSLSVAAINLGTAQNGTLEQAQTDAQIADDLDDLDNLTEELKDLNDELDALKDDFGDLDKLLNDFNDQVDELDELGSTSNSNKQPKIPNFDALLDESLDFFKDEENLQELARMITRDSEQRQIVISHIQRTPNEPKLKSLSF